MKFKTIELNVIIWGASLVSILYCYPILFPRIMFPNAKILWIWSCWSQQWWRKLGFPIILHWHHCGGLSRIACRFSRIHGIISNFIGRLISICLVHDVDAVKETDEGHQGKGNHDNANTNRNCMIWFHFINNSDLIRWNAARLKN